LTADRLTAALADRYRIERELGAGGMATVYLADDLRHERKVAIKLLKPELAAVIGAERFVVEIKTTANLQHPHILPLFDSGTADGFLYYVMPYIAGETLRSKLDRENQLDVDEAVRIAVAVADALDYAHRQGVIHRDIKPENILLHDGRPVVADFGIALALSAAAGGRITETGMSLGTPHYMSPEQATADKEITGRSDIYSLGSVLYEMLTGEPPHMGTSAQQIIMKIVTEDAQPVTRLRKSVPPNVAAAVAKAVERLPADRFGSAGAFAAALSDPAFRHGTGPAAATSAPARTTRGRVAAAAPWAIAALAVVAAGAAFARPRPPEPVRRYGLGLPPDQTVLAHRAVPSPDGSSIVFVGPLPGESSETIFQLWIKHRDRYEATPIPGTIGAWNAAFSPDGKWLAYVREGRLMKVALSGGSGVVVADSAAPNQPGIAWLDDGSIVFVGIAARGLRRVSSGGGPTQIVFRSDVAIFDPSALPGSEAVLVGQCVEVACASTRLLAVDLRDGTAKTVVDGAQSGRYLPTGHLLYLRDDLSAFAVEFDARRLETRGSPVSIIDSVAFTNFSPQIAVSDAGTMVVRRGSGGGAASGQYEMVWVDRSGSATAIDMGGALGIDPGGGNPGWALSPDGRRLAIGLLTASGGDIWVKQLPNGPLSRASFDSLPDIRPRWLADGRSLAFVANRANGSALHRISANGTGDETVLARHADAIYEGTVSPDGEWTVVRIRGGLGRQGRDIVGFRRGDTVPVPLVASPSFDENAFQLSPDGRWIAYESDETGRREVYLRPFPETGAGKWQASTAGGYAPLWAPNGRELFFVDAGRRMTAMPFTPGTTPQLGERRVLFTLPDDVYLWENDYYTPFDISRDGQRFVMARRVQRGTAEQAPVVVVENWFTELRERLDGR
jgi:serine/threonine-protein kinase